MGRNGQCYYNYITRIVFPVWLWNPAVSSLENIWRISHGKNTQVVEHLQKVAKWYIGLDPKLARLRWLTAELQLSSTVHINNKQPLPETTSNLENAAKFLSLSLISPPSYTTEIYIGIDFTSFSLILYIWSRFDAHIFFRNMFQE